MKRFTLHLATDGDTDIVNLHAELTKHLTDAKGDGLLHLFAVGSTCALTTIEFEPGLIKHDLKAMLQRLIPLRARGHLARRQRPQPSARDADRAVAERAVSQRQAADGGVSADCLHRLRHAAEEADGHRNDRFLMGKRRGTRIDTNLTNQHESEFSFHSC